MCFFFFLWMLHFVIVREEEHSRRVCENRVLRGIFGSEGRSDRRIEKSIYGGGFSLFTSPSVIRIINSKQIQLA